ncbi:hypothetical protein V1517DRAFT_334576 [Lipomyces orientalis]|uniref:Uncharacterized protein n=1 Tax=Lipomyces orientalis TaxID=1233043 RepID=A0ACC3TDP5_9ASCO
MPTNFTPSRDIPDLARKVILITGGTSGIGRAAVLSLAEHNPSHIYFTGRNAQAGAEVITEVRTLAPACPITFIQCDLCSPRETIRAALSKHFNHSSRLDIFIANAGVMAIPHGLTPEGYEVQFGTNHMGHAVMMKQLRGVMARTADSNDVRFVALSSVGHNMHPPGGIQFETIRTADALGKWANYGQSKLANILYCKAMAKRYPKIMSVAVHPGLVRTGLSKSIRAESMVMSWMSWLMSSMYKSPEEGVYNTLWAATTPRGELTTGGYYEPVGKKTAGAKACSDEALADKLWDWTEEELKDMEEL